MRGVWTKLTKAIMLGIRSGTPKFAFGVADSIPSFFTLVHFFDSPRMVHALFQIGFSQFVVFVVCACSVFPRFRACCPRLIPCSRPCPGSLDSAQPVFHGASSMQEVVHQTSMYCVFFCNLSDDHYCSAPRDRSVVSCRQYYSTVVDRLKKRSSSPTVL